MTRTEMDTSTAKIFATLLHALPSLVRLGANLLIIYLTLGWHVRKARKAFEKQLISQGMPKKDAKRLSKTFVNLKNDIINMVKHSAFSR